MIEVLKIDEWLSQQKIVKEEEYWNSMPGMPGMLSGVPGVPVSKRVFNINVGSLNQEDVKSFMEKAKQQFQKMPIIDPKTGNINIKYDAKNIDEDYYL